MCEALLTDVEQELAKKELAFKTKLEKVRARHRVRIEGLEQKLRRSQKQLQSTDLAAETTVSACELKAYLNHLDLGRSNIGKLLELLDGHEIDFEALCLCEDADLKELGLSLGTRIKLLRNPGPEKWLALQEPEPEPELEPEPAVQAAESPRQARIPKPSGGVSHPSSPLLNPLEP